MSNLCLIIQKCPLTWLIIAWMRNKRIEYIYIKYTYGTVCRSVTDGASYDIDLEVFDKVSWVPVQLYGRWRCRPCDVSGGPGDGEPCRVGQRTGQYGQDSDVGPTEVSQKETLRSAEGVCAVRKTAQQDCKSTWQEDVCQCCASQQQQQPSETSALYCQRPTAWRHCQKRRRWRYVYTWSTQYLLMALDCE